MHQLYIAFCVERLKLDSQFLNEEVGFEKLFYFLELLCYVSIIF